MAPSIGPRRHSRTIVTWAWSWPSDKMNEQLRVHQLDRHRAGYRSGVPGGVVRRAASGERMGSTDALTVLFGRLYGERRQITNAWR